VKTISTPKTMKELNLPKVQEASRKDIEQAFSVFQA
jgi:hypothetical protein